MALEDEALALSGQIEELVGETIPRLVEALDNLAGVVEASVARPSEGDDKPTPVWGSGWDEVISEARPTEGDDERPMNPPVG